MPTPCTLEDRALFKKATRINLGDGSKANFWTSARLQGHAPKDIAPTLYKVSKKKSSAVRNALLNNTWI